MNRPKGFNRFVQLAGSYIKDPQRLLAMLAAVKEYAKSKKHLIEHFKDDLQTLIYLLRDWIKGTYSNVPSHKLLLVIAALLYFLSPIDTIPDFLGAIGFADDAAVILFVLNIIKKELSLYKDWRLKK